MNNDTHFLNAHVHAEDNGPLGPVSSGLLFVGLMLLLFMPGWLFIAGLVYIILPVLRL